MKNMGSALGALVAGVVFAMGLTISGMTQPAKVVAFLDVGGEWDPSLAFVMVGAIGVYAVLYRVVLRRSAPVMDSEFHLPTATEINAQLLGGAALFGLGWGLAGFCPGPALASIGSLQQEVFIFIGSMALGMAIYRYLQLSRAETS